MRIIAGEFRGRTLSSPDGAETRPILDRVKQAVFDRVCVRLGQPSLLDSIDVLDLYCGGGSLGLEALSRGAARCCFVDESPAAIRSLRANVESLGIADRARIVAGRAESAVIPAADRGGYSLVFLDPPYPLSLGLSDASPLGRTMTRLGREIQLGARCMVVWRFPIDYGSRPDLPGGWRLAERCEYGSMSVAFLGRETA